MSPKNKKKLEIIRSKLDKLDNKLLSLIKYRTNLVKEVLKLKQYKSEIVDKKRINFILKKINKKSKCSRIVHYWVFLVLLVLILMMMPKCLKIL